MLHTIYGIEPGESVLINAIGGGVGLFTTQLAVKAGVHVIGTVGTPGKETRALEYGAERVIVTRNEDFEQAVLEFTGGGGVDLAINSLGATMLDRTFNVVRKLGHIISIGEAEGQPFKNIRERILPRSQTFTRLHIGHVDAESQAWKDSLTYIPRGVIEGWLKVPIAGTFPMEEAAAMHRYLESRQAAGKLVLEIAPLTTAKCRLSTPSGEAPKALDGQGRNCHIQAAMNQAIRPSQVAPASSPLAAEVERRRTFAIISHPDAGKTTLTEKLLLFGGAIKLAGQVRAKRDRRKTRSDWMAIERERGISVVTSVMTFDYRRPRLQPARHARPRGFFRGYLSHADRGRLRR